MGMQSLDERTTVEGMPVGYMQFIECAREIDKKNIKLIVFDEPTAVLTEVEAKRLLEAISGIAAAGVGIIFISHKLDEVISISDRIVVSATESWFLRLTRRIRTQWNWPN